ncbi:uncharacterized protein BDW70DRAFT_13646 [Aspergillus foveolatus]|uniref:uncharacterized protein n=1 Tax=Aspergillus foveolatus TaxID=210207 RepID=UPI003CCCA2A8
MRQSSVPVQPLFLLRLFDPLTMDVPACRAENQFGFQKQRDRWNWPFGLASPQRKPLARAWLSVTADFMVRHVMFGWHRSSIQTTVPVKRLAGFWALTQAFHTDVVTSGPPWHLRPKVGLGSTCCRNTCSGHAYGQHCTSGAPSRTKNDCFVGLKTDRESAMRNYREGVSSVECQRYCQLYCHIGRPFAAEDRALGDLLHDPCLELEI